MLSVTAASKDAGVGNELAHDHIVGLRGNGGDELLFEGDADGGAFE